MVYIDHIHLTHRCWQVGFASKDLNALEKQLVSEREWIQLQDRELLAVRQELAAAQSVSYFELCTRDLQRACLCNVQFVRRFSRKCRLLAGSPGQMCVFSFVLSVMQIRQKMSFAPYA